MTADITSPVESFLAKLERRNLIAPEARTAFLSLPASIVKAGPQDIVAEEGEEARHCLFVSSGFLSRQKRADGTRRIMGLGIPGDAVDLQSLWFRTQDHSLVAHKKTTLVAIEHADIIQICDQCPPIARVLWHDSLVDAAIFRAWTLNIGHRRARSRLAHLFLEMATRQQAHGLIRGDIFELPLTQSELASALGLSLVHLNKSLKVLRDQGHVRVEGRIIELLDRPALEKDTGFDPAYLHLTTPPRFPQPNNPL